MDLLTKKDDFLSMAELINDSHGCTVDALPRIDDQDLAVIIFTSGTLGRAKGVMLSQRNLAANLIAMVSMMMIYPEDRFLSVLPIHHTYECTCGFLCPLYSGASVHYARSLKTVVDDLQQVKATMLLSVPLMFDKMFKRVYQAIHEKRLTSIIVPPLIKITDFAVRFGWKSSKKLVFAEIHERFGGHIRAFIAGGAAPDPMVAKGLRALGFTFVQGYGLTETSPILTLNQLDNFKDDAAGLPLPGVELKIHSPHEDGVGEVWVKGANVMIGFYKNEKVTREVFEDSWFMTGDLGSIDGDGFLHICGRKKNIQECLVYGENDPKLDEIISAQIVVDAEAFIELSEARGVPITPELINDVIASEVKRANAELTSFKQIKKFTIREQEFEKTTTLKVKRYLAFPK